MKDNNVSRNKKNKKVTIGITLVALIVIIGVGFAFFSASVSNTNHETVSTETATLSLKFDDGDNGISGNLNLGESITKKFTLQNTGTLDAYAKINWYNLVNTYMNGSLTYNLEESESKNGTYTSVEIGNVPVSNAETIETLKNGILVPVNTTYYYKLTITFNNLEVNQNSDINANFHSFFSLEEGTSSISGVERIQNLVAGANINSTDVITKEAPSGATCTNTLAYDGTVDNNLRYVGANPCNYVIFNRESPVKQRYEIIDKTSGSLAGAPSSETMEACEQILSGASEEVRNQYECKKLTTYTESWRIIGVMNNVDDGTGKKETRIKLVRNDALGTYSWDTSDSSVNYGYGVNDWTQADLKNELNEDYLDTTLTSNTMWYNGSSNQKTAEYDYTKGLNSQIQELIGNTKWYLGGIDENLVKGDEEEVTATKFYEYERETEVWVSSTGQTCDDAACPRATSWTGKIALMYPSDYGFAVGNSTDNTDDNTRSLCLSKSLYDYSSNNCGLFNWIRTSDAQHLLSPSINYPSGTYCIDRFGSVTSCYASDAYVSIIDSSYTVRPTLYLKSSVSITGGDGSGSSPYILE